MAALTASRNTDQKGVRPIQQEFALPVAAAVSPKAGGIAVIAAGYVRPGYVATTLIAVGVFQDDVDNSAGAAGAKTAKVRPGCFKFENSSAGDLIAQADVGTTCFIVDDQTVAKTNGTSTRSAAGKVVQVDSDGVWVQISGLV